MQTPRETPQSAFVYRQASTLIGARDTISVVPGHWIDCQSEPGAPGEREFNMDVCCLFQRLTWEQCIGYLFYVDAFGVPFDLQLDVQFGEIQH